MFFYYSFVYLFIFIIKREGKEIYNYLLSDNQKVSKK